MPLDLRALLAEVRGEQGVAGLVVLGTGEHGPPLGAPLLVVPPSARARLDEALTRAGWHRKGSQWARFDGAGIEHLGTLTAPDWLPPADPEPPLPRELLLRALAAPAVGPAVPAAYRVQAHRRLAEQPAAWLEAHDTAAGDARRRVVALQDAYETGLPLGTPAGASSVSWPGATVALSGLDGAGKTTQAHLLAVALDALGHDAAVEWARLGFVPRLDRAATTAKRAVRRVRPRRAEQQAAPPPVDDLPLGARRDVRRPLAVEAPWSLLVASSDVRDTRLRRAAHHGTGRVVVRDRYLLDSLVHVAGRYGDGATGPARALLRAGLPEPTCAFLLELPADTAFARKPGEWRLSDLERHAEQYARVAHELGVVRLDARRPAAELAAVIAENVWRALP